VRRFTLAQIRSFCRRVVVLPALLTLRRSQQWWYGGRCVPTAYRIYLYCHLLMVMYLSIFTAYERYLPGSDAGIVLRMLIGGPLLISLFATLLVPLVSLRILYLARNGGPSYVAFAVADVLLSCVQWFATHVASL